MSEKMHLGKIALRLGLITEKQLEECLQVQKKQRGMLGQILCDRGYISPHQLVTLLKEQKKLSFTSPPEELEIVEEIDDDYVSDSHIVTNISSPMFSYDEHAVEPASVISDAYALQNSEDAIDLSDPEDSNTTPATLMKSSKSSEIVKDNVFESSDEGNISIFGEAPESSVSDESSAELQMEEEKPSTSSDRFSFQWTSISQSPFLSDSIMPGDSFQIEAVGDAIDLEAEEPKSENHEQKEDDKINYDSHPSLGKIDISHIVPEENNCVVDAETRPMDIRAQKPLSSELQEDVLDLSDIQISSKKKIKEPSPTPSTFASTEVFDDDDVNLDSNFYKMVAGASSENNAIPHRIRTAGPNEATVFANNPVPKPSAPILGNISFPDAPVSAPKDAVPTYLPPKKNTTNIVGSKRVRAYNRRKPTSSSGTQEIIIFCIVACVILFGLLAGFLGQSDTTKNTINRPLDKPGVPQQISSSPNPDKPGTGANIIPSVKNQESTYTLAIQSFHAGRLEEAFNEFGKIPNYKESRLYRAECLIPKGKKDLDLYKKIAQAKKEIEEFLKTSNSNRAYVLLAKCFEDELQYAQAEESYRKALELDSKDIEALRGLARTSRLQGKYIQSIMFAQKATNLGDPFANSEISSARRLIMTQVQNQELQNPTGCVELLESAIKEDPDYKEYYLSAALFLWKKDPTKALAYIEQYIDGCTKMQERQHIVAVDLRIYCLYCLQRYDEMEGYCKDILQINTRFISLASILGLAAVNLNKDRNASKEQKNSKDPTKDYKKNAYIFYHIFNKIFIARSEFDKMLHFNESFLLEMSQDLQGSLSTGAKLIRDIRQIRRVIQIDIAILPIQRGLNIEDLDVIHKINEQSIYSVYEIFRELPKIKKLTLLRQGNTIELEASDISTSMIEKSNFIYKVLFP